MLNASTAFKNSIVQPIRNRGYIKVTIGIISLDAQENAVIEDSNAYPILYYSDSETPFRGTPIDGEYATAEHEFSRVDGSRFFAPETGTTYIRNNGALSDNVMGGIYVKLTDAQEGYNISGLSIDFGPVYPTSFQILTDNETYTETNNNRFYESDLSFVDATYMIIVPMQMVGGSRNRLRIYSMKFGKALTFGNEDVIQFNSKEYVSPICDSVPSYDMTLTVSNVDNKFDVDDDYNVMSFMNIGQEVTVQHGYDVSGNGTIEWLDPYVSYLATWDANNKEATFTSHDKFAIETKKFILSGDSIYDGNHNMGQGATAIANQAYGGALDFSSPTLDDYIFQNPLPNNTYPSLLQMIANATKSIMRIETNGVLGILDSDATTDYTIALDHINGNIVAKKTSKIQSINVSTTLYTKNTGATAEDVSTTDIYVSTTDGYAGEFTFDDCFSDWAVTCEDSNVTASIIDSNPRYVSVVAIRNSGAAGTTKLTISGKKYAKSTSSVSVQLNDSGDNINWDNPLISNATVANSVANWLADYYRSEIEYELNWRGDPRIEAGDVVTLQRQNKTDVQIRIVQNEFFFNGAWSGHILGRRIDNG